MVVLCNLFSCHACGWKQRSDRGYAAAFPTDDTDEFNSTLTSRQMSILRFSRLPTRSRTPVWGGRLGFKLFIPVGGARTEIDALVTGALGPIGFSKQNQVSDTLRSFGDPAPQLSLKWNEGVNNFMVYSRGGIPVGDYNPDRIVNLGRGQALSTTDSVIPISMQPQAWSFLPYLA